MTDLFLVDTQNNSGIYSLESKNYKVVENDMAIYSSKSYGASFGFCDLQFDNEGQFFSTLNSIIPDSTSSDIQTSDKTS